MITTFGALLLSNITVTLPDEVQVRGAEMTLGEVATITGEDLAAVERLRQYSLGYAPSPGYSRVVQGWQLEQRLEREFAGVQIDFAGKPACRVSPSVTTIPKSELETVALDAMKKIFEGADVEIHLAAKLQDQTVPQGLKGRELVAEPTSQAQKPGSWTVPVKILIDGLPYRTIWASYRVDLFGLMPVLKRDVAAGEELQLADVVMRRAPLNAAASLKPLNGTTLAGSKARRLLRAGEPVGVADVTRRLAVSRGETVILVVNNGMVRVSTEVVALRDGYIGDQVPIQTYGMGKELTAKAVGVGQLELKLAKKN